MLNLALRKQIHSTHTQGNKSHTCTYMELQNISLGFHVPNTKETVVGGAYVARRRLVGKEEASWPS